MTKSIKRMKRLFAWGTALLLVGGMHKNGTFTCEFLF